MLAEVHRKVLHGAVCGLRMSGACDSGLLRCGVANLSRPVFSLTWRTFPFGPFGMLAAGQYVDDHVVSHVSVDDVASQ